MKMADAVAEPANDTNAAFSITATGKAFKILSDGLYSDKITAVIRELCCNAYDSHISAKKADVPFVIKLPTDSDRVFYVQDFGLGLSDADIHNIYTKYFTSTKTNNDELIGQLGLGSKSPFSLVREFTVESTYNGVCSEYLMYFDATDTPRVKLVNSVKTTDVNGVKVSFEVSYEDAYRFRDKAERVLEWFKVTPQIIYAFGNIKIDNKAAKFNNDGWFMGARIKYTKNNACAVMGNVMYPLDAASIKGITIEQMALLQMPLYIRFNIGDFEVSASRESIGYDNRSSVNIITRLQQVHNQLYVALANKISSAKNEWEARLIHNVEFNDNNDWGWQLAKAFTNHKFMWNGIEIKHNRLPNLKLDELYPKIDGANLVRTGITPGLRLSRVTKGEFAQFQQFCSPKTCVIFDDLPKNGAARIKLWSESNVMSDIKFTVFEKPTSGKGWKHLTDMLGNPDNVIYTSKLPAPPKKERAKKTSASMMIFVRHAGYKINPFMPTKLKPDSGFYVNYSGKQTVDSNGEIVDLNAILDRAITLGFVSSNTLIYAGKGYRRQKIRQTAGWVDIVEYVRAWIVDELTKIGSAVNNLATRTAFKDACYRIGHDHLHILPWKFRDDDCYMARLMKTYAELYEISESANNGSRINLVYKLASIYGLDMPQGTPDPRIKKLVVDYQTRYPMLRNMNNNAWTNHFNNINDYVDMVDMAWVYFELTRPDQEVEE